MTHAPPAQFIQAMEKLAQQKEILENFVRDQSQNLREVRVTFNANEKLLELSRVIQEYGEVKVSRTTTDGPKHSVTTKVNMLTTVPNLFVSAETGYFSTGIALLENGQVVLSNSSSNNNNKNIELHDTQCSTILSSLSLPSWPYGVKMISDIEGAVAVSGYGLILFMIQNNQIVKVTEIKTKINYDFMYHRGQYYIGCNLKKIARYDKRLRRLSDIKVNNNVGYMAVRDDNSLCYTSAEWRGRELYCITMDGTPVFTYSHDKLHYTTGVTVDHAGFIYVCGRGSRNIHQLSNDGKLQRIMFDNLPAGPYCISFNTQGDKAVMGCEGKVLLYDLK